MKSILLLALISGLMAQDFDRPEKDHERSEKMEMMMVWKLTDELALTTEQAEKFFPRFRQHRQELDDTKKMERALGKDLKQKVKKDKDISEKDVKETIKKMTELRKQVVDLESNFLLGMDDLLSPVQLARLGMFKQKMMKNVRGELKEHREKKGKRGKNNQFGKRNRRGF
ncbi:MAG: hypothetical protein HOB40_04730 [Candidatus Marinimicrobia bacterium]|jgi:Spy/CpxP family protein refolding chaperone|nr:hypothetical protein [Candidatus Neomarinimicrobiota bacterium]MBT3502191.1 hypothetical protein [Candidatus Neomarinimicrobiota bacterium]MBT3839614.1 hypothetical protein [Candidatus Neomarinimicrobiota bacterium]MBT3998342.1 hypothetical protein [Candidatus Neomarinimicrobiota bacterium]MBT4282439.1 hypothetical protein [Candidatus Neomarinimicrobiota bacterium]